VARIVGCLHSRRPPHSSRPREGGHLRPKDRMGSLAGRAHHLRHRLCELRSESHDGEVPPNRGIRSRTLRPMLRPAGPACIRFVARSCIFQSHPRIVDRVLTGWGRLCGAGRGHGGMTSGPAGDINDSPSCMGRSQSIPGPPPLSWRRRRGPLNRMAHVTHAQGRAMLPTSRESDLPI